MVAGKAANPILLRQKGGDGGKQQHLNTFELVVSWGLRLVLTIKLTPCMHTTDRFCHNTSH